MFWRCHLWDAHSFMFGVGSGLQAYLVLRTKESPKEKAEKEVKSYSQQYCIINFKIAKRLDVKCSHYKKEMVIMGCDRGVS